MVNRFIKLLSMFLAVVLLVNMLPLGIMAQDLQNSLSANTTVTENVEEADVANAEIVTEIPEKRTEYSKEFLLSDGMRLATIYPAPVHYQTDEGWVDIDNTLVTKADGTYTNADAPWSVSFPKELTNENKVTVDVDGYSLSFVMEGQVHKANPLLRSSEPRLKVASKAPATVKQPGAVLKEMKLEEDKTVPQKLYSQLTYADVFENTDVIYDLESNAVKESIVLQQYDETLEGYRYTLYTGNLVPVMDATGHIDLYADGVGEPVISLPSPYLLDDVGEYCDEVKVTLTGGDGVYTMTYSLPQQWLAAEERAWPVILDPIVKANTSASNIQDRTFCEIGKISYKKSVFYAGFDPELGIIQGYLKYNNLPILNSSDVIVKAEFSLNKVMDSSSSGVVEVHKVTSAWTSKEKEYWKDKPSYDENISDYKNVKSEGWYTWNVTDIVRDWYAEENNGLMIKMPDSVEEGSIKRFRQFYSSDTGATSKRPKLKITIRNNNGLEGYWDYTSTSAGRAGTGHVNKFTGNLTWVREDMGFAGCIMPVSISHVYNLNDSTAIDTGNNSNQTAGNYFGMGSGWRINYSERVYQWSTDSKYYIWEDEDGTDHYFKEKTSNTYIDEDNPDLTLTRTKKDGKITKYQIKDKKGNLRIFDESGRLTTLQNNWKKDYISKIKITYDDDSQRIETISDSANRLYYFTYTCGLLTKISYYGTDTNRTQDPLREIIYTYDRCICTNCTDHNIPQQPECCDNCVIDTTGDDHVNLISISEYFGENDPNNYTCTFEYKEDVLSYTESGTADNDIPSTDSSDDDVEDSEDAPGTPGDDDTPDDVEPEETTPTESTEPTDSTEPAETPESSEDTEIPEETEPSENTEPVEPAQTTEPTEGSGDTDSTTDASLNRYLSVLTGVNDYTGYRLDYEYYKPTAAWRPYRVKTITESYPKTGIDNDGAPENDQTAPETPADANEEQPSAGDDQQSEDALRKQGGSIHITYGNNETTFVDHWGKKEVYQFNDFGNTICIQDDQGRAQFSQFAFSTIKQKETNTDATKKTNQLTLSSDLQYSVANLMIHNGTPTPDQWQAFGEDATCTKDTAKGSVDKNSLKVQQSSTTSEAGVFGVTYKTSFVIKPGEAQTFSCDLIAGTPVFLRAQSTLKTVESEPLEVGTAWYRQQVTYTNDSNQDVTVTYSAVAEPGAAFYLDCPQLENAHSASRYNLVNDGDFSTEDIWTKKNCTDADKFVSLSQLQTEPNDESLEAPPIPQANDRFVVITGDTAKEKSVTQTIEIAGKKGDSLTFGGWAKGDSVPLTTSNSKTRKFAIECTIVYKDTSKSNSTFTATFNPDSNEWQYTAGSAVAKYDYKQIKMSAVYNYNANTAMFDGIQLYKDAFGSTFKYDKNGNVVSVTDSDKKETKYGYDENDNLISEILPTGTKLTYDYDEYHKPTKATTDEGLVYTYKYDNWGNNIQVSISDGTNAVTSKVHYTDDGNLIDNTTDAMGKVTKYGYNEKTGVLEWVQKPGETEDTRTNYTYDSLFRMTQASVGEFVETDPGIFAQYAYENELLAGITTQTVEYGFAYNDLSLRTSASVDGQEIVGYTYYGDEACPDNSALAQKLAIDGALYSIDYANGDMVVYTYDDMGRLIQETYTRKNPGENDQVETVTYAYDNAGSLASVTDSSSGITSKTLYDTVDRPVRYTETGGSHDLLVRYRYDSENRIKYILYMVDNNLSKKAHNAQYTYDDDNRIDTYRKGNGVLDYTYDKLNRTVSTKLTHKGNDIITTQYAFVSPGTKQTSTQVSTVTRTVSGVESTDHYKYDDRGNIEEVWHNGDETKKITYSYDTLNQLIREDNPFAQYTHIWEYDGAGNILSRTEYPYTKPKEDLPESTKAVAYIYLGNLGDVENGDEISTDNAWSDTLLSYDGQPITYDEMGNPLDDGTREYTWKNGRELASIEKDNKTWTFAYNADGMRTKRHGIRELPIDGDFRPLFERNYDYVYYGDQLMYMSVDGYDFILSYTPEGVPMGITFKGTAYYYETNLQGDVIGILNHDGERLISYSYDAWGNPLTPTFYITELQQFQLAPLFDYNPLRYRGYVYDTETGLYYVGSRYYNPETGRFINADNIDLLGANGDFASLNLYAYCGNNPVSREDDGGECWNVVIGAVIGGVFELGSQLYANGGDFSDVNWSKVGIATAVGGITALCGPVSGAIISGVGNVAMEAAGGTTNIKKLGVSFAVGAGASLVGYGIGKAAQKIGGKIALNNLSKKSPGQIKRVVNKVIDVAGRDRNRVKNLSWTLSQKAYRHLPDALIGEAIPQAFNSIGVGVSGYGTMGAIYGFK